MGGDGGADRGHQPFIPQKGVCRCPVLLNHLLPLLLLCITAQNPGGYVHYPDKEREKGINEKDADDRQFDSLNNHDLLTISARVGKGCARMSLHQLHGGMQRSEYQGFIIKGCVAINKVEQFLI